MHGWSDYSVAGHLCMCGGPGGSVGIQCSWVPICGGAVVFQHKWTPAFAAAWKGHKDVVEYLLRERNCSCDVVDVVS